MKRVNYILTLAACLAALLTSCIKEESYTLETLDLQVNVTRAGSTSEQQGDKIENVMIWAFEMDGNAVKNEVKGWRTYTPSSDTYTSVEVHIPLPMCNGSAKYRLVAVINKDKFGAVVDKDGNALTLDANTTYPQLAEARFASDVVNASLTEGKPGTPEVMPVSHWVDVTVSDTNVHPACLEVEMPVFRALGKTQLFMARNNQFQLELHDVTLINAAAEAQGVVLAGATAGWATANGVDVPSWFTTYAPGVAGYSQQLISSTNLYTIEGTDNKYIYNDNSTLATAASGHDVAHYVCGKVLYETDDVCTYSDDTYKEVPTGNGYYYKITYEIGNNGTELTRYVPLPPIVRNHDYQVRALVKEDGGIVVSYTVADWEEVEWNLAFDAAQHTNLLPAPDAESTPTTYPTVRYTIDDSGAAVFYFQMTGPEGITWKPTLMNVNADDFAVRVYEVINDSNGTPSTDANGNPRLKTEEITGDVAAVMGKFYAVKVVALHAGATSHISDSNPIQLKIAHAPQWNEEKESSLVINPNSGTINAPTYFWPTKDANGAPTYAVGDQTTVYIYPGTNN